MTGIVAYAILWHNKEACTAKYETVIPVLVSTFVFPTETQLLHFLPSRTWFLHPTFAVTNANSQKQSWFSYCKEIN